MLSYDETSPLMRVSDYTQALWSENCIVHNSMRKLNVLTCSNLFHNGFSPHVVPTALDMPVKHETFQGFAKPKYGT